SGALEEIAAALGSVLSAGVTMRVASRVESGRRWASQKNATAQMVASAIAPNERMSAGRANGIHALFCRSDSIALIFSCKRLRRR
ncbi:UNVERIFIED_CONTAM: hypothetical protein IGO34_33295, partial [Salmonella enterica subsp. enterica serovar Weltevreden]